MQIEITLTETDLKRLVIAELQSRLGNVVIEPKDVRIQVKSKQNYKADWEVADFRATLSINR